MKCSNPYHTKPTLKRLVAIISLKLGLFPNFNSSTSVSRTGRSFNLSFRIFARTVSSSEIVNGFWTKAAASLSMIINILYLVFIAFDGIAGGSELSDRSQFF